ncbi:MAG: glutamine--tRNA ligase, partial [Verrucomicrobia bacterium]|nr:glutamine--tRNA ligase [Verrucomicrobiota bacterium]
RDIVGDDLRAGKYPYSHTRFPPEPNGYLHIGHAKSICLNFGIAREFGGVCNLRMNDTNPTKEETEYVESIVQDVNWLIAGWADQVLGLKPKGKTSDTQVVDGKRDFSLQPVVLEKAALNSAIDQTQPGSTGEPFYASDYFEQFFEYAVQLISKGKAYVDELSPTDTDSYRVSGKESPFRGRSPEENLKLFQRMRGGEFPDGHCTLRAKIDMQSPNVWLRDPVLYRIRHSAHHRTGDRWCIYPMYDFAHCLSDYIEGVTHSVCTLEFEVHRPLYDWILENLELPRQLPHQYEFARLNLNYTVLSKRKLMQLVEKGLVSGWDDPRMPTISGLRRRGVTASALRAFAYNIGITKYDGVTDFAVLEHAIRDELNKTALRRLAVLRPIKVILTNYPEDQSEILNAVNNPEDPNSGTRTVTFRRELYIDRDDFMENPPPKYFRLRPGGEVRLKYAYIIKCEEVIKDAAGNILELRCTADLDSKSGGPNANRKVKGTIHWVSAADSIDAEVRLYDRLFLEPEPETGTDFERNLNPASLEVVSARCEPSLEEARSETRYQFERIGYFVLDKESTPEHLVFNRTVTLKDSWAKEAQKPSGKK